ncbi:MBL fold metallo-hydrolase [Paracraurococcus ruber]|uniref:MBL fold metallo-hydrolase n=1 Tax=Paracraurococcus ruber TaxID=77675 RepID=A0ABS1CXG9_9PROT|nr:MBL fold metallo-hydrolase [Paracraurococcus ruber]MBK1659068.1 MBL fold metallo-hydrolase [Paracraurococcus ruber]TDG32263.1 MBL fold metallo-hydrolase [Paracraurococcus ruber]
METTRRAALAAALALPAFAGRAAAQPAAAPAMQAPGWYRFQVGGFTVTTVFDGYNRRAVEGLVRNAPLPDVQATLAESFLPTTSYDGPYTVTFVDTGRQLIAFDAGTGGQMAATAGLLPRNMAAAGLDPARVGLVVITHCHQDHIHGLTTREGEAVFPNAQILVAEPEWAWWSDPANETRSPEGQRANFANVARRFAPYRARQGQFAPGAEIVPGIHAIAAHGHSPGHCIVRIADGGAQAMLLADTTHRPELFARRPGLHSLFDFDPQAAEATRRRVLDMVATDRLRVIGYHFPFPAVGHVAREGAGYRYIAAEWA